MNVVSRGVKNALRSPLRSGAIILMLAISIGLIMSMLVARSSVNTKIAEVKATAGTAVTISPAGVQGFQGGGDPLTAKQVTLIEETEHVASVVATLSDQLGTDDTDLESSLELGSFGERQQRFEGNETETESSTERPAMPEGGMGGDMASRTTVTGTTDVNSVSTDGSELTLTSGESFASDSTENVAVIGSSVAETNSLTIGDTFTAYDTTITVVGIYETGNTFQDSGVIMPLATLQTLTDQAGAVSSIAATIDSSDNVETAVAALEVSLGDAADITSSVEQAEASVASLQSISGLALAGVIGATIAGAVIVLLAMIMVVRERRREIGVIKAIGGSNTKVIGQFMSEALTLTVIGAAVGLLLGIVASGPMTTSLVSSNESSNETTSQSRGGPSGGGGPQAAVRGGFNQIANNVGEVTGSVTPGVFALALGMTFLIAIIGSAVPAWFIARIQPAEVLRTE